MAKDVLSKVSCAAGLAAALVTLFAVPAEADIENRAQVTATSPDGQGVSAQSDNVTIDLLDPADLVTVVAPAGEIPVPGGPIAYQVRITNGGPAEAVGVALRAALPDGVRPGGATASTGSYDPVAAEWRIARLPVGQTATLDLEGTVEPGPAGSELALVVDPAAARNPDPTFDGDFRRALLTTRNRSLAARDDTLNAPVDSIRARPAVIDVLAGDTIEGVPATPADVAVNAPSGLPPGFMLNDDGAIDVAQYTAPGDYAFAYRICDRFDPANCASAEVRLVVERSRPLLSGTVFDDTNDNGVLDGFDPGLAGYRVMLTEAAGGMVTEVPTDQAGQFAFQGFDRGRYGLVAIDPVTGIGVGRAGALSVGADDVIIDRNIAITPTGVVHDGQTGVPVAGATVRLIGTDGAPLPDACLLPGQQGQVTGADGRYWLTLASGAAEACPLERAVYRLMITPPNGYAAPIVPDNPPTLDPALCPDDRIAGGPCHVDGAPIASTGGDARFFASFAMAAGDPPIAHNHVPVMPAAAVAANPAADGACPSIAGVVYRDIDRDGTRDPAETGVADALITVGADRARTDAEGSYVFRCIDGGSESVEVTLDEGSLDGDLRAVAGARQSITLTPGVRANADFAVAPLRIVSIDLAGAAFGANTAAPEAALRNGIVAVAMSALAGPSILRLTYHRRDEPAELAQARLDAIANLLVEQWARRGLEPSTIETRIELAQ